MVQNIIICFSKKEQLTRDVLSSIRKMYGIYKIEKKINMEGAQFDQSISREKVHIQSNIQCKLPEYVKQKVNQSWCCAGVAAKNKINNNNNNK